MTLGDLSWLFPLIVYAQSQTAQILQTEEFCGPTPIPESSFNAQQTRIYLQSPWIVSAAPSLIPTTNGELKKVNVEHEVKNFSPTVASSLGIGCLSAPT
jgi:hypothetical protein